MKRTLILLLVLLMAATSAFTLAACSSKEGTIPGTYKNVELDTPEQQANLADTISAKIMANVSNDLGGGTIADQWMAQLNVRQNGKLNFEADLDIDYEDAKMELDGTFNLEHNSLQSVGYSEQSGIDIAASADIAVKGGLNIPRVLLNMLGLDEEQTLKLQNLLKSFNYGASIYMDNSNVYAHLSESLKSAFAKFGVELPSDKIKLNYGNPFEGIVGYSADADGNATDLQAQLSVEIADILKILKQYKVDFAVSEDNGWALRISVSEETVKAIFADRELVPKETADLLNKCVSFRRCRAEFFIGFDKDNKLSKLSSVVDVEINIDVEKSLTVPVSLSGSFKLEVIEEQEISADKVTLPSDLDTYTDLDERLG